MKKKILLSSVLTIVLCLSLIAGSTFALFTSTSQVSIAATAGNVEMTAGIEITKVESVEGDENGTIEDENGFTYSYLYEDADGTDGYTFINGGTASVTDSVLTMTEVTPGDKITLQVTGKNDSDIAVVYRYKIDCVAGEDLMKGLMFTVNNVAVDKYMATYTSPWIDLAKGNDIAPVTITVELPVSAGNIFQNQTTEIRVIVEAIQANAVVEDNVDPVITYYNTAATAADAADLIADPFIPEVNITEPIAERLEITSDLTDKNINANGNVVEFLFKGKLDNVVVSGVTDNGDAVPAIQFDGATGDITIEDCVLTDHNSQPYGAVAGGNADLAVTLVDCVLDGARPVYNSGNAKSLTLKNCEIKNTSSWAILINTAVGGNVEIDNCTFTDCVGIVKVTKKPIGGKFIFTNNKIVDSRLKDGKWVEIGVATDADLVISGNTIINGGVVEDSDVTVSELPIITVYN